MISKQIIKNRIEHFGSCFFDAIFPKRCVSCGNQGEWLCAPCDALLFFRPQQDCLVCGRHNDTGVMCPHCSQRAYTRRFLCAFGYRQAVPVRLVKLFKYDFVRSVHGTLARLLIEFFEKQSGLPKDPLVLAVPLHEKRRRWRGYNQSAMLAKAVADHFGWHHDDGLLLRHKATDPQAKMESSARRLNVDGCFSVKDGADLRGRRVLLVDDVITTGATVEACALALKRAGARSVDALALIRG